MTTSITHVEGTMMVIPDHSDNLNAFQAGPTHCGIPVEGPLMTVADASSLRGERPFATRLAILAGRLPVVISRGRFLVHAADVLHRRGGAR